MEPTTRVRRHSYQCAFWRYRERRPKIFYDYGGDWPVLMDTDALWAVAFGVLRPPESFLAAPGALLWLDGRERSPRML